MREALRCSTQSIEITLVLQLAQAQRFTGRLSVEGSLPFVGTVDLYEGHPTAASCGPAEGAVGVLELFLIPTSRATLSVHPVREAPPLREMLALILEGCRLRDEWIGLRARALEHDPAHPLPEGRADGPGLRALLAALDGSQTLAEAIREAGLVRAEVIDPVRALLAEGILSARDPTGSAPASAAGDPVVRGAPSDLRFFEALELGRRHHAHGAIAEAAEAFRAAVRLEPAHPIAEQNLRRLHEIHPELSPPQEIER